MVENILRYHLNTYLSFINKPYKELTLRSCIDLSLNV
jgi:hypothetical protein